MKVQPWLCIGLLTAAIMAGYGATAAPETVTPVKALTSQSAPADPNAAQQCERKPSCSTCKATQAVF